ncbi:MAG: YfiR family protein [Candidatus Ozemobacteraceae bacterium]
MFVFRAARFSHSRMRLLDLFLAFSVLVCCPGAAFPLEKTSGGDLELQVKAAYLYNFTKFVYWSRSGSDDKTGEITIAVIGADSIRDLLEGFSKNGGGDRPIVVQSVNAGQATAPACHLLFIGRHEQSQWPALSKRLAGTDILTVSDIPGFARQGGMIGLFIENDRVGIEINMDRVRRAGLKISAKLLEIARIL